MAVDKYLLYLNPKRVKSLSEHLLRLEVDDDLPSSVDKVLSDDDLLTEILLRLPIFSLRFYKPVCKQWLSVITSIPDPPSGIFIKRPVYKYYSKYYYQFVPFDPRIPKKRSIHPSVGLRWMFQSCNGLFLCENNGNRYVCNPSINMTKMLPPLNENGHMYIAFDPTKSPCYKVVSVKSYLYYDYYVKRFKDTTAIQIYSSETGIWRNWSVSEGMFPTEDELHIDFGDGIYWNGSIHWLSTDEPFHVKLDIVDHPNFTNTQTPLPVHYYRKLFKSHGSLLLLCMDYDCSRHFNIYEMKNEYSVWLVKYSGNIDDMLRPYAKWTTRPTDQVLSIVLGERDEDSFMVIELSGKILKYKFVLKTVSELFDLGEVGLNGGFFEYIASFAHV